MNMTIPVLAVLLTLAACDPPPERIDALREESSPCDLDAARILGRAYQLSFPDIERARADDFGVEPSPQLVSFIRQTPALFSSNSGAIACATAFGRRLMAGGANAYDKSAEERAIRMWGPGMPTELPGRVASSMQEGALDLFALGQEMQWLADVLPAAAAGNWGPYLNTGTPARQASRQAVQWIKLMISINPQDVEVLRQTGQLLRLSLPSPEDQVIFLALALGISQE